MKRAVQDIVYLGTSLFLQFNFVRIVKSREHWWTGHENWIEGALCNSICWLAWGFSLLHIQTFSILTWPLGQGLISYEQHDSSVHILQQLLVLVHNVVAEAHAHTLFYTDGIFLVSWTQKEIPVKFKYLMLSVLTVCEFRSLNLVWIS